MTRPRHLAAVLAVAGLAWAPLIGCAGHAPAPSLIPPDQVPPQAIEPPPPDPAPQPADTATVDELLRRLDTATADYTAGIDLISAGDEVAGEQRIAPADTEILTLADECAALANCDVEPFLEAYRRLMSEQAFAIKRQASRIAELEASAVEAEEAEREPGTSAFVSAMPEIGETASLFRGSDLRDMIELNTPVKAALDDWLTWMRPMLMDAYENYEYLREDIAPIYEKAGLPEALLFAMIATESGGKVHSFSRAGAAGLLQFMRYTGRRYGLGQDGDFDLRLDPEAATRANVAYLNERFEEMNHQLEKALAAYNGGEGRLRSLQRRFGDTSFWDSRIYYSLPAETREYVPRILAAAWLFLHPEQYNLQFPGVDTARTMLALQRETTLSELTICLGQAGNPDGWFRTLRNLNPRLEPGDHIEAGTKIRIPSSLVDVYGAQCLDGDLVSRARELHDANYPDEGEMIPYIVRRGDTLGRIASRHRCVSMGELAAINDLRPPRYVIHVGQTLEIPACP